MKNWARFASAACLTLFALQQSCTCKPPPPSINLDGSSTVYVMSEAIAEEFSKEYQSRVSIGISGTGGGFKKLCTGRIKIIGASRPINEAELKLCQQNNITPTKFEIALDGIVLVVNPKNTWLNEINIPTLKRIFEPEAEGKILKWSDVNPSWPQRKMAIFVPGISSGTYDYFTEVIVGKAHASRGDLTSSEDDNVLVHGVSSNPDGIAFVSFAYYKQNERDLKAVLVFDPEDKAIMPSRETIQNGTYRPLSRPVFVYADQENLNPAEFNFLRYYLENSARLALEAGFVPLEASVSEENLKKLRSTSP